MPIIPTTCKAELSIVVQGQFGGKELLSTRKLHMLVYPCNPSYTGGMGRTEVSGHPWAKSVRLLFEK
jgi:hypothetical protein